MITYRDLGRRGRLGNQLFELASTIGIARAYNQDVVFPEDWIYRPHFSVPDEMFGPIPDHAVEAYDMADAVEHIDPRVRPYLQDYRLFADYIDEIREYLQPSLAAFGLLLVEEAAPPGTLGIHVRRGDNVIDPGIPNKSDYHLCPSFDYYNRGADQTMNDYVIHKVAIYSDDYPACRENWSGSAVVWGSAEPYWKEHEERFGVDEPQDWIDLFGLSECDHFVVSGSTFGIWAALLADVPGDHVTRPDKVYGPLLSYIDSELLFPPDWKVLPLVA